MTQSEITNRQYSAPHAVNDNPSPWMALGVLTAARAAMGFQFQSLASAAPELTMGLGLSQTDLGALIGLYFLPGVFLALPGGALGRRYGDRRMVMAGLLLMVIGGLAASMASGFGSLAVARTLAGVGGVLLNVLMSKMVIDWFAGRKDLSLAMAIFVNSFPIGVGLAIAILGPLATAAGWTTALAATSGLAAAALVLLAFGYSPHPNDRAVVSATATTGISAREAILVCVAGSIWGIFNGGFSVMFSFAPAMLAQSGIAPVTGGLIGAAATWLLVASVIVGGFLARKDFAPATLMATGAVVWSGCLAIIALGGGLSAPALLLAGLTMGLPVGVIMSLPATALRPESRALGMGLFYTWLYIGHGLIPPIAGRVQDATGSPAAPLYLAAGLVIAMLPLYWAYRWGSNRGSA
jgi:predicted MFS family arabinose efflux permease